MKIPIEVRPNCFPELPSRWKQICISKGGSPSCAGSKYPNWIQWITDKSVYKLVNGRRLPLPIQQPNFSFFFCSSFLGGENFMRAPKSWHSVSVSLYGRIIKFSQHESFARGVEHQNGMCRHQNQNENENQAGMAYLSRLNAKNGRSAYSI